MSAAWRYVRSLFARVGSDPYYASYERSLSNIKSEVDRLQVGAGCRHRHCRRRRCTVQRPTPPRTA